MPFVIEVAKLRKVPVVICATKRFKTKVHLDSLFFAAPLLVLLLGALGACAGGGN